MKNGLLFLMLILSLTTSAQTIGKKLENKANEAVDKVIDKIDIDNVLSRKEKKSSKASENTAPREVGENTDDDPAVPQPVVVPEGANKVSVSTVEKSGKYTMYYQDVMMGDQKNTKFGQFFVPSTGHCVDVEVANEMQKEVAMVLFNGYGGALILTFPGNAKEADLSSSYDEIEMFKENDGGMGSWGQENINSGQLYKGNMSDDAFEKLA